MPIAEGLTRPDVHSACLGVAGRKPRDRKSGWDEEENGAENPDGDGARTAARGGRYPADADDTGEREQDQVAEAEFPA